MHLAKSASLVSAVCSLADALGLADDPPHALRSAPVTSTARTAAPTGVADLRSEVMCDANGRMPPSSGPRLRIV
jgi:hypothetical protein